MYHTHAPKEAKTKLRRNEKRSTSVLPSSATCTIASAADALNAVKPTANASGRLSAIADILLHDRWLWRASCMLVDFNCKIN